MQALSGALSRLRGAGGLLTGPAPFGASVLEPLGAQLKTVDSASGFPEPAPAAAFPVAEVQPFWQVAIAPTIERLRQRGERAHRAALRAGVDACDALGLEVPHEQRAAAMRPLASDAAPPAREGSHLAAGEWHRKRADKLATDLDKLLGACGERSAVVSCGCQSMAVPVGCGRAALCLQCAKRLRKKMERKVRRAMAALSRDRRKLQRGGRGSRLDWHLVTFTCAHSGDVPADRKRLAAAFNRWRAWLHGRVGEALPYVLVWEVTNGSDDLGHVHGHAAMLLPFLPYDEAAQRWAAALGQTTASLDFQRKRDAQGRQTGDRRLGSDAAAKYIAKYIAKGCKAGTRAEIVAQWMAAQYGRRAYSASQGFWVAAVACPCGKCGVFWEFGGITPTPWDAEALQDVRILWRLEPPDEGGTE